MFRWQKSTRLSVSPWTVFSGPFCACVYECLYVCVRLCVYVCFGTASRPVPMPLKSKQLNI